MKYFSKILAILLISWQFLLAGGIRDYSENEIKNLSGKNAKLDFLKLALENSATKEIEKAVHQRFFKDWLYVWKIVEKDSLKKYAILDNVYGKLMPITFLVILNAKGNISAARVIKYREAYGGQISNLNWLKQFVGKDANSRFTPGQDIDAISGATISVNAITRGIKKLTLLFPYIQKNVNLNQY